MEVKLKALVERLDRVAQDMALTEILLTHPVSLADLGEAAAYVRAAVATLEWAQVEIEEEQWETRWDEGLRL